ncbi:phosphatase PAP2 family protein [Clostridium sp. WILCCON 0269]|uniref:Phosphatase PAP2 family protein n=1 Tax=Candidatus Clostridium eludens TaxID=3381663 RepID=A0ABW8SL38_9CLOT
MLKNIKLNLIPLSLMLVIPLINIMYGKLNNAINGCYSLATTLDKNVPFIKEFIIPYWMWYPFLISVLIHFCFVCRNIYYKTMITILLGMISCYITYFFFQTTVTRPFLQGNDIFIHIVRLTYKLDKPFNCFPSIHVLTSYAVMRASIEAIEKKSNKYIINIIGAVIILSTQFVKQHVILDLIFAIILAEVIYRFAAAFILERGAIWKKKLYWWLTMKKKLEI